MSAEALKLTSYFSERRRSGADLLSDRLLALYGGQALACGVLLRGAEGYGAHRQMHSDRLLSLSEELPAVAVAIDRRPRIEALMAAQLALQQGGLVTLERALLLNASEAAPDDFGGLLSGARRRGGVGGVGAAADAFKLTLYVGRRQRIGGRPAYAVLTALLQARGFAGASVLLGVDGTVHGERRRAGFFSANRQVPLMVIAVGTAEQVAALLPELGGLLGGAPVTLERVRVCKRDGDSVAPLQQLPESDQDGLPLWRKLMIYSSHACLHEGEPLHRAILLRLRAAGAAGVTVLRGIWGFHGSHRPHGDRLLQIRRHLPMLTIVIGSPAESARHFALIDELTGQHGLVTSELVPALHLPGTERSRQLRLAAHRR